MKKTVKNTHNTLWFIEKIINVANQLDRAGSSTGSTGETIAAAFVLDRMEFLPEGYSVIEAWERLDESWQQYVKETKRYYSHILPPNNF